MIAERLKACNVDSKQNSKGHTTSWIGYKLHIDAADGGIPVSCILTSASLHDSQATIPLAEITYGRVTSLYDMMDVADDAPQIKVHSRSPPNKSKWLCCGIFFRQIRYFCHYLRKRGIRLGQYHANRNDSHLLGVNGQFVLRTSECFARDSVCQEFYCFFGVSQEPRWCDNTPTVTWMIRGNSGL